MTCMMISRVKCVCVCCVCVCVLTTGWTLVTVAQVVRSHLPCSCDVDACGCLQVLLGGVHHYIGRGFPSICSACDNRWVCGGRGGAGGRVCNHIWLFAGFLMSAVLFFLVSPSHPHWAVQIVLGVAAFTMSIVWMYLIANEVVSLLQAFGLLLGVDTGW